MGNWRIGKRRKGIRYDYNWDGQFAKEKWNTDDKRYWNRWRRRSCKKDLDNFLDTAWDEVVEEDCAADCKEGDGNAEHLQNIYRQGSGLRQIKEARFVEETESRTETTDLR